MQTDKKVTELVIDEERRLAWIQFPSGAKSQVWESKEEAIDGVCQHLVTNKITIEEHISFLQRVATSNLPMAWSDSEEVLIIIAHGAPLPNMLEILFSRNPTFTMCDCGEGERHGCIEDDDGHQIAHLSTRYEAFSRVNEMLKGESIDKASAEKLWTQIQRADFGVTKEFPILLN